MTQKEQILTEWLLRNNFVWDNIDSASKGQSERSYYSEDEIDEIHEINSEEIK